MKLWFDKLELDATELNYIVAYEKKLSMLKKETYLCFDLNDKKVFDTKNYKNMDLAKNMLKRVCYGVKKSNDVKYVTLKQGMLLVNVKNITKLSYKKIVNGSMLGDKYQTAITFKNKSVLPVALFQKDLIMLKHFLRMKNKEMSL